MAYNFNVNAHYKEMAQEYATQYCSTHGGNFTHEELVTAFIKGTSNEPAPQGFQCFLAWKQGMIFAGNA